MGLLGLIGTRGGISWTPTALNAYLIEKSIRFSHGDSPKLSRTFTSTGDQTKFTLSLWFKNCDAGAALGKMFLCLDNASSSQLELYDGYFTTQFYAENGSDWWVGCNTSTDQRFRDPSAWYHLVLSIDTAAGTTNADRHKLYINGEQLTLTFATAWGGLMTGNVKGWNSAAEHFINMRGSTSGGNWMVAEYYFIDGQALTPSDFGEIDSTTGVWYPKEYAGTYGTNGFYLKFDGTNLGEDSSGNNNDWTATNLIVDGGTVNYVDSLTGSPYLPINAFSSSYINTYINTTTFAITNAAWTGAWDNSQQTNVFTPSGGLPVTSSLLVYYGCYSNAAATTTLLITYTDSSTETDTFTSGTNNWMGSFTASNAAGKTIQSISIDNAATFYQSFGGFVIDGAILESYNPNTDISTDSPTNDTATGTGVGGEVTGNYATINPLGGFGNHTLYKGNLEIVTGSGGYEVSRSTIATPLSGKWYAEMKVIVNGTSTHQVGLISSDTLFKVGYDMASLFLPDGTNGAVYYYSNDGTTKTCGASGFTGATWGLNDIIGIAYNADDQEIKFYKNGVLQGTNTNVPRHPYVFGVCEYGAGVNTYLWNFGQRDFVHAAPSGFKSLSTTPLPDPTIGDPAKVFDTKLWTGNGSTQNITGYDFSPDLVWTKQLNHTSFHALFDPIRGVYNALRTNTNAGTYTDNQLLTAFNSDGFSLGSAGDINNNGGSYVGFAWDAGDSNTSATVGSLNSVSYDQSSTWSSNSTVSGTGASINNAANAFNGNTSASTYSELASSGSVTANVTFTCTTANVTLVEVFPHSTSSSGDTRGTCLDSGNNTYQSVTLKDAAQGWYTIYSGDPITLANVGWGINQNGATGTSSDGFRAFRINGKMLVDSGLTPPDVPTIASTYRVNPTAGFSITDYRGNSLNPASVAHGLNAKPDFMIIKNYEEASKDWVVYHKSLTAQKYLVLNTAAAAVTGAYAWHDTPPDSNVFTTEDWSFNNSSGGNCIAYCWSEISGYSKFGKYLGSGTENFINTGFKPAMVLIKQIDGSSNSNDWYLFSDKLGAYVVPTNTSAEPGSDFSNHSLMSNGFHFNTSNAAVNGTGVSNHNYIYCAWAESPFKYTRGGIAILP